MKTPSEYLPTGDEIAEADAVAEWFGLIEDGAIIMGEELPPVVEIVNGLIVHQAKVVIGSGSKSYKT